MPRVAIGIDVGWSNRRRSCAIAISGIEAAPADGWRVYGLPNQRRTYLKLFMLADCAQIMNEIAALGNQLKDAVIVIDGPIFYNDRPNQPRLVDTMTRRGIFNGRAQPSDLHNGAGPNADAYVDATNTILNSFLNAIDVDPNDTFRWFGGEVPENKIVIAETNPTVGMALLLPPQDLQTLPSRARRRVVNPDHPAIALSFKAKSDWYWYLGADGYVGNMLGNININERHHERIAGLYCVGIASLMTSQPSIAIAIGNNDGVYAVSPHIAHGWQGGLNHLTIGAPVWNNNNGINNADPAVVIEVHPPPAVPNDIDGYRWDNRGDDVELFLCDNGGVWRQHNDWLADLHDPVTLHAVDQAGGEIVLTRGQYDNGQWTANPTALAIARMRGFQGNHLNLDTPHVIPCVIQ